MTTTTQKEIDHRQIQQHLRDLFSEQGYEVKVREAQQHGCWLALSNATVRIELAVTHVQIIVSGRVTGNVSDRVMLERRTRVYHDTILFLAGYLSGPK